MSVIIFTKSSIEAAGMPATGHFYYRLQVIEKIFPDKIFDKKRSRVVL